MPPRAKPVSGLVGLNVLEDGAFVTYERRAFKHSEATAFYQDLQHNTDWLRRTLTVMGKKVQEPRAVCYQGESESLKYSYSGTTLVPIPFSEPVLRIRAVVQALFPEAPPFNTVLMNFYESGEDHLAFHSDYDLRHYGPQPFIASVSFGAERDFVLRRKADHERKVVFALGAGDALLMHGACQEHWEHGVPTRKGVLGGRINLTFRHVLKPA